MPRTKLKKTANKRTRHSTTDEARINAIAEMDRELETMVRNMNFQLEQHYNRLRNNLRNIKSKLSPEILAMTMGDMHELLSQGCKTYDEVQAHLNNKKSDALLNITNTMPGSARRTDDGYLTGDSIRSEPAKANPEKLGPFRSAKAKPRRRSRSVNSALQHYTQTAPHSQQIMNRNIGRESRSKLRTPASNRIQTMSADRCMGPVTPKVPSGGQSIAMLRYPRQGETVISLDGSPVVATNVLGNRANLNIPVADGVISIQPMNGVVDSNLVQQIDKNTLEQLRQLQDNLHIIMQAASDYEKAGYNN